MATLVAAGLQRGVEHRKPREYREAEYQLHGTGHLINGRMQLLDQCRNIDHGQVGKSTHQFGYGSGLVGGQVKAGDVAGRKGPEHVGRRHDEEIDPHRIPVKLSQTGNHGLDPVAGNVVDQTIAEFQIQRLGQTLLHRKFGRLRGAVPASAADSIAGRKPGRPRQIELAIDQTLGAIVGIAFRTHRLAIDQDQTTPHHRLQFRHRQPACREEVGDGDTLIGLDIDGEPVRRISRHPGQPAIEQVAARHGQQQQGREAECQRHRLHHGCGKPAAQVGQAVTPSVAPAGGAQTAQGGQQQARRQCKESERHQETRQHDQAQAQFSRHPQHQRSQHHGAQQIGADRSGFGPAPLTAQHADRRHPLQAQQRRQSETDDQREPHQQAMQPRQQRWRGQPRHQQTGQQLLQRRLHDKACRATGQCCREAEQQEFAAMNQQQLRPGCAHAAHYRAAVEMPPHIALGGQRHRDSGKNHRQQRSQPQKALGPLSHVANLGTRIVQAFDFFAATELPLGPVLVRRHGCGFAGQMQTIADTAATLDQAGRRQISQIDHQARCQRKHVHAAIRFQCQYRPADNSDASERKRSPSGKAQCGRQTFVGPGFARLRHTRIFGIGSVEQWSGAQDSPQRIAGRDRLDFGQQGCAAEAHHAREGGALGLP